MSVPPTLQEITAAVRLVLDGMMGELCQQVANHLGSANPVAAEPGDPVTPPSAASTTETVTLPDNAGVSALSRMPDDGAGVTPDASEIVHLVAVPPTASAEAAIPLAPTEDEETTRTLHEIKKRLEGDIQELEDRLATARSEIAQAGALRLEREEHTRAASTLEAQRTRFEAYQVAGERADLIMKLVWPNFLREDSLVGWKDRLETRVLAANAPGTVVLLFAALHTYTAAFDDADTRTLQDAMRDVGRRLYAFLKQDVPPFDEHACSQVAEQWAHAINRECAGRGEVEVPVPGNAASFQWMTFQPRGGSSPDVLSVRNWCVRDAQKRPVHRADVVV